MSVDGGSYAQPAGTSTDVICRDLAEGRSSRVMACDQLSTPRSPRPAASAASASSCGLLTGTSSMTRSGAGRWLGRAPRVCPPVGSRPAGDGGTCGAPEYPRPLRAEPYDCAAPTWTAGAGQPVDPHHRGHEPAPAASLRRPRPSYDRAARDDDDRRRGHGERGPRTGRKLAAADWVGLSGPVDSRRDVLAYRAGPAHPTLTPRPGQSRRVDRRACHCRQRIWP